MSCGKKIVNWFIRQCERYMECSAVPTTLKYITFSLYFLSIYSIKLFQTCILKKNYFKNYVIVILHIVSCPSESYFYLFFSF